MSQIRLNGRGQIVRDNGPLPDEIVARVSGPSMTAEESAAILALPEQSALRQAYLNSTAVSTLIPDEVAKARALTLAAAKQAAPKSSDQAYVRAAVYPMNEGTGATLSELSGRGPAIAVGGVTSGAWANASWFSHDAAGNTIKLAGNPSIDGLLDMSSECSILIGADVWFTTWPNSTEVLWAIHRPDLAAGGVRMPMTAGGPGRISIYYRSGGASETEAVGYTMPGGTFLNQRISTLTELRVLPAKNELHIFSYVNGRLERGRVYPLGTAPLTDASGGLSFSGQGNVSTNKLGSGASSPRTALCFAARYNGKDRNVAGRLASHIWANRALPDWLNRI